MKDLKIEMETNTSNNSVGVTVSRYVGPYTWAQIDAFTVSSMEQATAEVLSRFQAGTYRGVGKR